MSLTTSWTPEQKKLVEAWVERTANGITETINAVAPILLESDKRPRQCYSQEQPQVFFPYVAQAMLEDLIVELQSRV